MSQTFNIEKLEKKFSTVSNESKKMLSVWIMHQKKFCDEICRYWLKKIITSDSSHRLTLFYVAQDVLLHCEDKNASEYKTAFAKVMENAVSLVKGDIIQDDVLSLIKIWDEKNIFATEYIMELLKIFNVKPSHSDESKSGDDSGLDNDSNNSMPETKEESESLIIASFRPKILISSLQQLMKLKSEAGRRKRKMKTMASFISSLKYSVPDKYSSKKEKNLNSAYEFIENYIKAADEEVTLSKYVAKLTEHATVFYNQQNIEFKHVAHAYRIFGKKLKLMQQRLQEKIKTFPAPVEDANSSSPYESEEDNSIETTMKYSDHSNDIQESVYVRPTLSNDNNDDVEENVLSCTLPSAEVLEASDNVLRIPTNILETSNNALETSSNALETSNNALEISTYGLQTLDTNLSSPLENTVSRMMDIPREEQTNDTQNSIQHCPTSQTNLLKSINLLQKLLPKSSSPRNIDNTATIPLSMVFHVISKGTCPQDTSTTMDSLKSDPRNNCEEDLVPTDMDLDSDNEVQP